MVPGLAMIIANLVETIVECCESATQMRSDATVS
jgi:hypothetical protein